MENEQRAWHGAARGALYGLAAAALFGMSAPLAKLLLADVGFLMLAALLYVGAGAGLQLAALLRGGTREAGLRRRDLGPVAAIVVLGGIAGPVLLLYGLRTVSGLAGSLLLNLEAPFTMLIAVLAFREHLARGEAIAAGLIVIGATALGWEGGVLGAQPAGMLAIAGACLAWAIDNNLTQKVSVRDPLAIVRIKTIGAGLGTLAIALAAGETFPSRGVVAAALALGFVSYGVSLLLDTYALRLLGAAREAAFFATAPFIGAVLAIPILGERLTPLRGSAFLAMAAGVTALLRARHGHLHHHEALEHEHLHVHDEHHRHAHDPADPPGEPHAHGHRHEPLEHEHAHVSDVHHRHRH